MKRSPKQESETALIDRLVVGRPPREQLIRRMAVLVSEGWTHREIGQRYGLSQDAVAVALSRSRRQERDR